MKNAKQKIQEQYDTYLKEFREERDKRDWDDHYLGWLEGLIMGFNFSLTAIEDYEKESLNSKTP